MKTYIVLAAGLILFSNAANAVMMAPWTRSVMPFNQVLGYLNENSLGVASLAYSKEKTNVIIASAICPDRKTTTLVFDVRNLPQGTEVTLNPTRSRQCM